MKKRIIIAVFLGIMFGLFIVAQCVYAGVLVDEKNNYSFEYPFDWQVEHFPNSKDLVKADMIKNKATGVQVRVYRNKRSARDFYERHVTDFMEAMEGHWGGDMVVLNKQEKKLGGYDCYMVSFDFTRRDGSRWFLKQHLWPRNGEILMLQSGTPYKYRNLDEPAFDSIAGSLEMR